MFTSLSHDEVLGFSVGCRDVAEDFLSSPGPTVRSIASGAKAAFVEVNEILRAVFSDELAQFFEVSDAFSVISLRVKSRFFYRPPSGAKQTRSS